MPSPEPSACPHCGPTAPVRAGRRKLKDGTVRQLYRRHECRQRGSNKTRTGRHTAPAAVLRAPTLVCPRLADAGVLRVLWRAFAASAISCRVAAFEVPALALRKPWTGRGGASAVVELLFTHASLHSRFRLHRAKLRVAPHAFPDLIKYLTPQSRFLDHALFERAAHCSSLRHRQNPGVRSVGEDESAPIASSRGNGIPARPPRGQL